MIPQWMWPFSLWAFTCSPTLTREDFVKVWPGLQHLVPDIPKKKKKKLSGKSYIRLSKRESERWLESWCDWDCVHKREKQETETELFHFRVRVEKALSRVHGWCLLLRSERWGGWVKGPPFCLSVCGQRAGWMFTLRPLPTNRIFLGGAGTL